ncbi:hypothetical protein Poli38472_008268 [Pythium oligandrum]|uniref:Uncharacterized protein n=1 Tax=Pythium oligandrum TaxID=41045 RepID=A0A8K1FK41_PYTOL|nr:hypothetical protein Poli38472_008268 [Pythium oligandrum]|eukprot:TMW65626.1 hypothetical protein Poli38472_008268 [Pythium oligandrum]
MHLQCALRVRGCPHDDQPTFSNEYKRSNRTRMSKILRCFPHCCPNHRARSYCGTALHLDVTLHLQASTESRETQDAEERKESDEEELPVWQLDLSAFAAPSDVLTELVVYGRFELHDPDEPLKSELALGQHVSATRIQQNQDPDVIWVSGAKVLNADESEASSCSQLFVLNEGDGESYHWEYDWKSGTSQRKRACQHQFRAYVFLPDSTDATSWQVVGMAASTPFTLSSYRKQDDEEEEGESAPAPTRVAAPEPSPPLPGLSVSEEVLLAHQHRPTANTTTKLAILLNFLSVIDIQWIPQDMLSSRILSILRGHSSRQVYAPSERTVLHFADHCLPLLTTALLAASPRRRVPVEATAWYRKWQNVLQLSLDLLCQLLLAAPRARLLAHFRPARVETPQDLIAAFIEWIAIVGKEVEVTVHHLSEGVTLDLLVDEIVSCMYDEDPEFDWIPKATRDSTRLLLRNTNLLGLGAFREQLRLSHAATVTPLNSPVHSGIGRMYHGAWSCVSVNEVAPGNTNPGHYGGTGFSALSSILLLSAIQTVEICMDTSDGRAYLVSTRSALSFMPETWGQYQLDGQFHSTSMFPIGITPALWLRMGEGACVGDYRGVLRHQDDGSVAMDLDLFAYARSGPSYWTQLTLVPVILDPNNDRTRQLHAHVRLYRGHLTSNERVPHMEQLVAMSPEERCECVMFSDVVVTVSVVYELSL